MSGPSGPLRNLMILPACFDETLGRPDFDVFLATAYRDRLSRAYILKERCLVYLRFLALDFGDDGIADNNAAILPSR